MIDFKTFFFAAPPRTGNAWILKACQTVGLGIKVAEDAHVPFPKERGKNELFRVSLVRNPTDWLRSCYTALANGELRSESVSAFGLLPRDSFSEFVQKYLYLMPGGIGNLFKCYKADSYLRIEDMPWAFLELLEGLGVPKALRDRCKELPKQNVSQYSPRWELQLRARVIQAERELCETYDYC